MIHKEFGLDSLITPEDILNESGDVTINQLALLSYLGQLQEHLLKDSTMSKSFSCYSYGSLNNKRILKFVKWHKLFTGEQGESSEPPRKKFQQPSPSVVLMEFSSKEPELMGVGMGMGVDLAMGNQLPDYIAVNTNARTAIQSQIETAVKTGGYDVKIPMPNLENLNQKMKKKSKLVLE